MIKLDVECANYRNILQASLLDTPLGSMLAISDAKSLYMLEFIQRKNLQSRIYRLSSKTKSLIRTGKTKPISSIDAELKLYFAGKLKEFQTPFYIMGTDFQQKVWKELTKIPYGTTISYQRQALSMGRASAVRAVANANGSNNLAIIIPCHRVVNSNGRLGGYASGLEHKQFLIEHEKNHLDYS